MAGRLPRRPRTDAGPRPHQRRGRSHPAGPSPALRLPGRHAPRPGRPRDHPVGRRSAGSHRPRGDLRGTPRYRRTRRSVAARSRSSRATSAGRRQRGWTIPEGVGDAVRVEYVSRVPRPPLDGLIDDLYYLDGAPPYARLTLPAAPAPLLIVNLGAPFRIRGGADVETVEYADGCVVTTPTRAWEFGYPPRTRSVGVHFKPWGLGPFLPMPAAELCDRPATVEQVWGRPAVAELRDRLAAAAGPHEMLTLLEDELMGRRRETPGLALV